MQIDFSAAFDRVNHLGILYKLYSVGIGGSVLFLFVFGLFSEQLWLFDGQVEDSTAGDYFFYPLTGTEHGSQPSLTTRDRELVSVVEVRIEPGDLNPRTLAPQSVTLPTLPRAASCQY